MKTGEWVADVSPCAAGMYCRTTSIGFKQFWKVGKGGSDIYTGTVYRWSFSVDARAEAMRIAGLVIDELNDDPTMTGTLFKYSTTPEARRAAARDIREAIKEKLRG